VTKPGGRLLVCEFGRPTWAPFRAAYYLGLERVLPAVAERVSSNPEAYRYLGESIRDWPAQPELAARIAAAGWTGVGWREPRGRRRRAPPRPSTVDRHRLAGGAPGA
jgi:demethylmenaquinone methyltransferase/2-methoxy-6-polyprenyl-1,4-benzoquinol methylase